MVPINIPQFRASIAKAGYTKKRLADELCMAYSTLIRKIRNNSFTLSESEEIIRLLGITDPCEIFFDQKDTLEVTEGGEMDNDTRRN